MSLKNKLWNTLAIVFVIALPTTLPAKPVNAGTFPGLPSIIKDTLPCNKFSNCIMLRERVHIFQGLGNSRSAINYCRAKYGNEATVEWKFGLRWCATPYQI
jgi:hypothetical protein